MSAVHFHLVFTHAVVTIVGIGVLILFLALIRRSHEIRMTGLGIIVLGALTAIPVYLTGESAEETVERLNVSEAVIEEHEEAAELTFIGIEALGAAALLTLLVGARRPSSGPMLPALVLLLGLVVTVMLVRTANLGGEIRHTEIRSSGTPSAADGAYETESDDD